MLAHFTRMALKAFLRFKVHSLVGLLSLVLGFSCFLFSKLLIGYLDSFDTQFPGSQRIYSVVQGVESESISIDSLPIVARPVAEHLRVEFPELEGVVRESWPQTVDVTADGRSDDLRARFVSDGFFAMFPIAMLDGVPSGRELAPGTVVISESAARRRFGTTDVVGKQLRLWHEYDVTIAGVWRTLRSPSHIESAVPVMSSDLIGRIEIYDEWDDRNRAEFYENPDAEQWNDNSYMALVEFPAGRPVDMGSFQQRLDRFADRIPQPRGARRSFSLQPIDQLAPSAIRSLFQGVDVTTLLLVAGDLVLLIACLNYSNLVIALLSVRGQEIGLQKILGAKRGLLVLQYTYEGLLFVALALAITVLVTYAGLAAMGGAGLVGIDAGLLLTPSLWGELALAVAAIVVIGGAYPAFRTLRGSLVTLLRPKGSAAYSNRLRTVMVTVQFMISCTLIVVSLVMIGQNEAMRDQLDGDVADPKVVITVPLNATGVNADVLRSELTQHPAIVSVSGLSRLPWSFGMAQINLSRTRDPAGPAAEVVMHTVGHDFPETLGVPILWGREFSRERANDVMPSVTRMVSSPGPYAIVIDEKTAAALGWRDARDAVGQTIFEQFLPPQVRTPTAVELVVAGIAGRPAFEIIDYGNLGVAGHVYVLQPKLAEYLIVRASKDDVAGALAHIDNVWHDLLPGVVLKRQFVDELFYDSYRIFLGLSNAIIALAVFGFLIAGIGLLGNATFVTNIRQREVGIRKVMGARTFRLVAMQLLDFARPVMIANLIAWPLGYVIARGYVSLFTTQASITAVPFLISFLISVMIACVAVVSQSYRSAKARPATILRYE